MIRNPRNARISESQSRNPWRQTIGFLPFAELWNGRKPTRSPAAGRLPTLLRPAPARLPKSLPTTAASPRGFWRPLPGPGLAAQPLRPA
jgi:hypothetical protein